MRSVFFLRLLQHHRALCFAGIEVALRNFFMHQVLVAIDAGGPLRFHLQCAALADAPGGLVFLWHSQQVTLSQFLSDMRA